MNAVVGSNGADPTHVNAPHAMRFDGAEEKGH